MSAVSQPAQRRRHARWSVTDPDVAAVLDWWMVHARHLPWRATRDVYAVWIAEVMSVQTNVTRAAAAWVAWMDRWPSAAALADASLADVLRAWQGLGYPRRARDLHRSARIIARFGWPDDLTELPGIGPYVAAAVRCFALEEPVLPLDVNVRRVVARRFPGGVDTAGDAWRAGQALMEFGQRICTARPRCAECPVCSGCGGPGGSVEVGAAHRQPRYEGSVRQRRGRLLRRVIDAGSVAVGGDDVEIAAALARDGLVVLAGGVARAPE